MNHEYNGYLTVYEAYPSGLLAEICKSPVSDASYNAAFETLRLRGYFE